MANVTKENLNMMNHLIEEYEKKINSLNTESYMLQGRAEVYERVLRDMRTLKQILEDIIDDDLNNKA
jgi:6-phosphogluconate dehydrogenase